ncbi:MAG: Dna2/Cas4 domain-containing protein [Candidatus Thermoplasmatota archaeon]|nr:Dna2/Cas4 domain-containing protein [Candidatus Thermoplasmatota archaeon]
MMWWVGVVLVGCGVFLCVIAFVFRYIVMVKKRRLYVPSGTVRYTDLHRPAEPLFSRRYLLTGKPDFVVEMDEGVVPVEYKSGWYVTPPENHVLQVAAYCLLVEDVQQVHVPFGWLVYPSGRFRVWFDAALRVRLASVMGEMRMVLQGKRRVVVDHGDVKRCRHCSFRGVCSVRLG